MTGTMKHPALAAASIQLALLLPVAIALLAVSEVAAYSALLGGILFILPNAYFTAYAFRYSGADADTARRVARALYQGQWGKLVLTVLGFAAVFRLVSPLNAPVLLVAYCFMVASQWFIAREVSKRMTD